MNMLLLAFAAVNPLGFPSYTQDVTAEFATHEQAVEATCSIAALPGDAKTAFSCRWDDSAMAHIAKAEMMKRAGVKGTFYLTDASACKPDYVKKLTERGHAIGNHTVRHRHMMTVNPNCAFQEIARQRVLLENLIQHTVMSYVSPFGWQQHPLDADQARTLAEAVVATGHFVTQDSPMKWSMLDPKAWMWTNKFNANDRTPQHELFVRGFARMYVDAKKNLDVPRVTLGTHSWCDEKGLADQEAWLKEFFHPEGGVQLNDWEYGAYRYQFLNGEVKKTGVQDKKAMFRVRRYAARYVGDAIPLSLKFSVTPVKVEGLAKGGLGTWELRQDEANALQPKVAMAAEAELVIVPDEAAAKLKVTFVNTSGETLRDVYLAAALPPKWSVRRVSATLPELKPGESFVKSFDMGKVRHHDYGFGEAYYPVSADFTKDDVPMRVWGEKTMPRVMLPDDAPRNVVKTWGPGLASAFADVDWSKASLPGAALPDAENWRGPSGGGADGIWNIVCDPIKAKSYADAKAEGMRKLIEECDHARYLVYDFVAAEAGTMRLLLNVNPRHRSPQLYVNGVGGPFKGSGQRIAVKKGDNRILLRADASTNGHYTDTLFLKFEK